MEQEAFLDDPHFLQRFELLNTVGQGPHGTVLTARHRLLDEVRSLKVLTASLSEDDAKEGTVRRFRLA